MPLKLEFRIPISPTRPFFHQVRFYEHALRKLGGAYLEAKVLVTVGDNASLDAVRAENRWSEGRNVEWICVPREIFARHGLHGTADYRYIPESDADFVVLSDADSVLARDIDPIIATIEPSLPFVAGHMAHHLPQLPESPKLVVADRDYIWPELFAAFETPMPEKLYRYTIATQRPPIPPYFNLGFVVLTHSALQTFRAEIFPLQERMLDIYPSYMRCQFAVPLIALRAGMRVETLPADYNLANDFEHLRANNVTGATARVIHYLRNDELKREEIVLPENLPHVLRQRFVNPVNQRLQELLRSYAADEFDIK